MRTGGLQVHPSRQRVGFPDGAGYQPQLRALAEWLLVARVVLWFVHGSMAAEEEGGRLEGEEKSSKARFALGLWEALALHLARTRREGCEKHANENSVAGAFVQAWVGT
jgi:hypothetical protein